MGIFTLDGFLFLTTIQKKTLTITSKAMEKQVMRKSLKFSSYKI